MIWEATQRLLELISSCHNELNSTFFSAAVTHKCAAGHIFFEYIFLRVLEHLHSIFPFLNYMIYR